MFQRLLALFTRLLPYQLDPCVHVIIRHFTTFDMRLIPARNNGPALFAFDFYALIGEVLIQRAFDVFERFEIMSSPNGLGAE